MRRRRPWTGFAVRAALIAVALVGAGEYTRANFYLGIATQSELCIPGYHVFLIDRRDTTPRRGEAFAFTASGLTEMLEDVPETPRTPEGASVFADGAMIVKIVSGMPGDRLRVTRERTTVNGAVVGHGLFLAHTLSRRFEDFEREAVVPAAEYVFLGQTTDSYDSRYWGNVHAGQIVGRAYAIF